MFGERLIDHETTRLPQRSSTGARYALPQGWTNSVTSVASFSQGRLAEKSRPGRFSNVSPTLPM